MTSGETRPHSVDLASATKGDVVLAAHDLKKNFQGINAVNGLNLRIKRGQIHALIGPNGAGKTTVFNLLTGFLPASSGQIFFNGKQIAGAGARVGPAALAHRGIIRSFQISAVFAEFTALENIRLALSRKLGLSFNFWRSERILDRLNDEAMSILTKVGLASFSDVRAGELAYGRKRVLELATTLAADPILMLLDEPTQGMGHEDVARITELIRTVAAGRTVLMVEHNLGVVETLAGRITVLARGAILTEGSYAEVSKDPQVIEAYMGASHA